MGFNPVKYGRLLELPTLVLRLACGVAIGVLTIEERPIVSFDFRREVRLRRVACEFPCVRTDPLDDSLLVRLPVVDVLRLHHDEPGIVLEFLEYSLGAEVGENIGATEKHGMNETGDRERLSRRSVAVNIRDEGFVVFVVALGLDPQNFVQRLRGDVIQQAAGVGRVERTLFAEVVVVPVFVFDFPLDEEIVDPVRELLAAMI